MGKKSLKYFWDKLEKSQILFLQIYEVLSRERCNKKPPKELGDYNKIILFIALGS